MRRRAPGEWALTGDRSGPSSCAPFGQSGVFSPWTPPPPSPIQRCKPGVATCKRGLGGLGRGAPARIDRESRCQTGAARHTPPFPKTEPWPPVSSWTNLRHFPFPPPTRPPTPTQGLGFLFLSLSFTVVPHTTTRVCKRGPHLEAGVPQQEAAAQDRKPRLNAINQPYSSPPRQPTLHTPSGLVPTGWVPTWSLHNLEANPE